MIFIIFTNEFAFGCKTTHISGYLKCLQRMKLYCWRELSKMARTHLNSASRIVETVEDRYVSTSHFCLGNLGIIAISRSTNRNFYDSNVQLALYIRTLHYIRGIFVLYFHRPSTIISCRPRSLSVSILGSFLA